MNLRDFLEAYMDIVDDAPLLGFLLFCFTLIVVALVIFLIIASKGMMLIFAFGAFFVYRYVAIKMREYLDREGEDE